jgi:TonB dependent receptor/TonB-dependent Receptor Plug Domain
VVATLFAARSAPAQVATDRSPRPPSQDRALVPQAKGDPAVPEEVSVRGLQRLRNALDVTVSAPEARKAAGTEGDPAKVVFDLPGVARPAFDSGGLVVWGSAPADTRVYVDGVEIPQLFHGSALRSTINGDLLRSVTLTPGAYGADYGRSIGGILRVETVDIPTRGLHGYLAADTLDGSAMVSGASGDGIRLAIAGRYGWLDGVLRAVDAPDVGDYFAIPRYRDYQAKAEFALRGQESLGVGLLGSADDLNRVIPDVDPARVRSETTSSAFQRAYLRYRRRLDDGSEVDVVPWIGQDTGHLAQRFGSSPAQLDQQTWRWGLRASHRSRAMGRLALAFGVDVDGSDAHLSRSGSMTIPPREGDITVFGQPPGDDTNADAWDVAVVDVAPYGQVDVDLGALALTAGLRLDGYLLEASRKTPRVGQTPSIGLSHLEGDLQPRVAARLRVSGRLSVTAAAGLYSQPPAPADLSAVFGTPSLGPERAQHLSVGEALQLTDALSAEVTAFYKWMTDLAVRDPSPTPSLAQALLQDGAGRSYGLQLLLRQRAWHGYSGWVAYTISRSERRDSAEANWRLFDYDQPHVLTILGRKEVGLFSLGVRLRFARGLPRSPVVGSIFDAKDDVFQPIFGQQNSIRLPDFWQIDVRVDRSFALGESARVVVYLEGLNVANHANAEEYVYSADFSRRAAVTGLPWIAVLGARVER